MGHNGRARITLKKCAQRLHPLNPILANMATERVCLCRSFRDCNADVTYGAAQRFSARLIIMYKKKTQMFMASDCC